MFLRKTLLWLVVACGAWGCASRESGYRITNETIAFIQPGVTTRADLVENLGPPLLDLKDPRVVAYSWGKVHPTAGARPPAPPESSLEGRQMGASTMVGPLDETGMVETRRWVCCIALDGNDRVQRVETIQLEGAPSIEAAVRKWAGHP
jgi:hypothetical protein